MQRELRRLALFSAVTAVAIVGVPLVAFALFRWQHGPFIAAADQLTLRPLIVAAIVATLCIVAVVVVVHRAERRSQGLTEHLTLLARRAEAIGTGANLAELPKSGVPELDRLGKAIQASDFNTARILSAERHFVSDASHQLRTPLTALALRIEEISVLDDVDAVHEEAGHALEQIERLTRVLEDLRQRSRSGDTDSGQASLDAILAALQREWQRAFERARRSIRIGGERGVVARGSSSMISQVIATLIENSLKHGAGTVEVEVRRNGPSVVIQVSDHGPGVDPALAPLIFERSVTSGRGTGLGLGVARGLASACGGRLELVSAHPATFAFFLSEGGTY